MGELVMEKWQNGRPEGSLKILRADPKVRVAAELMYDIQLGTPWTRLDGDVLTPWDDFGNRFIYRVGAYDLESHTYSMEWSD